MRSHPGRYTSPRPRRTDSTAMGMPPPPWLLGQGRSCPSPAQTHCGFGFGARQNTCEPNSKANFGMSTGGRQHTSEPNSKANLGMSTGGRQHTCEPSSEANLGMSMGGRQNSYEHNAKVDLGQSLGARPRAYDATAAMPLSAADMLESQTDGKSCARAQKRCFSPCSTKALESLHVTNEELTQIEQRVAAISAMLSPASEICSLKSELSQLETRAKRLETKGIDDVYTGELHSGKQMAKDAKKDMLVRFEKLFGQIDKVFAAMTTNFQ